jgi:hypothetical protein
MGKRVGTAVNSAQTGLLANDMSRRGNFSLRGGYCREFKPDFPAKAQKG